MHIPESSGSEGRDFLPVDGSLRAPTETLPLREIRGFRVLYPGTKAVQVFRLSVERDKALLEHGIGDRLAIPPSPRALDPPLRGFLRLKAFLRLAPLPEFSPRVQAARPPAGSSIKAESHARGGDWIEFCRQDPRLRISPEDPRLVVRRTEEPVLRPFALFLLRCAFSLCV